MSFLPLHRLPGFSSLSGWIHGNGSSPATSHKVNLAAAVPPSPTDDSAAGYSVGSLWIDLVANTPWVCVDDSVGAALWSSGAGGSGTTDRDEFVFTSAGIVVGNAVRRTLAGWTPALADDATNAEVFGVAKTVVGLTVTVITNGVCDFGAPHGLGANGDVLFLSPTIAGALTTTAPSTVGQVRKPVAIIIDSNRLLVTNMLGILIANNNLSLTNGRIFVGNGANQAAEVLMSGDATISNTGVLTIANAAITLAKMGANSVDSSKIVNGSITGTDIANTTVASTNMTNTGVAAGSYTLVSATVDAAGRITAMSSGAAGAGSVNRQYFTASGSWVVPAGVTKAVFKTWGGAGGGGGAASGADRYAGGGGGGGYAERYVTGLVPGTNITVTIGAGGGAGSSSGGNGGNGGTTSIGAFCVATGGAQGHGVVGGTTDVGGNGGIGTTGDLVIQGERGQDGFVTTEPRSWTGLGGNPPFMVGTRGPLIDTTVGNNGGNASFGFAAGGSGAISDAGGGAGGSAGRPGLAIIEW